MPAPRFEFYADRDDLETIFHSILESGSFKFVVPVSEVNQPIESFISLDELMKSYGRDLLGCGAQSKYDIFDIGTEPVANPITMADGSGVKLSLSPYINKDWVEFGAGGEVGDQTLLVSHIAAASTSQRTREMMKLFKKVAAQLTTRTGAKGMPYHLAPGAIVKLKEGWRLTRDKSMSRQYDPVITEDEVASL